MPQPKRGLGKGLGALIPTGPPSSMSLPGSQGPSAGLGMSDEGLADGLSGTYLEELPVGYIVPNPRQPRQVFDEDSLAELAASIQAVGLLQPVVVRQNAHGQYELIMGERRWRACQLAGIDVIPAIVRQTSDDDLLRDALIENLHREQLNPLEEAAAYQQLLDDFGTTHDELARRIGRSRPHISNTIRLLNLPPAVQKRVAAGVLSAGHARALLGVEDPVAQEQLAHRIVAEGLSVRAVEEIVSLGAQPGKSPRVPGPKAPVAPGLKDLADRLSDVFETRVKVELGQRKGKIVVEFASLDDLERIVRSMSPGLSPSRRGLRAEG
ncbi:MAG TPA: ParB/RepB/Spo0J family partition protein [Streptosporangiaceae bacterium]|jgi:ParB family chromosome partitioning protein